MRADTPYTSHLTPPLFSRDPPGRAPNPHLQTNKINPQSPDTRPFASLRTGVAEKEIKFLHPTPYTLHPTPYTLHPTPYTLHPTPYTLHPTPYTLVSCIFIGSSDNYTLLRKVQAPRPRGLNAGRLIVRTLGRMGRCVAGSPPGSSRSPEQSPESCGRHVLASQGWVNTNAS